MHEFDEISPPPVIRNLGHLGCKKSVVFEERHTVRQRAHLYGFEAEPETSGLGKRGGPLVQDARPGPNRRKAQE